MLYRKTESGGKTSTYNTFNPGCGYKLIPMSFERLIKH